MCQAGRCPAPRLAETVTYFLSVFSDSKVDRGRPLLQVSCLRPCAPRPRWGSAPDFQEGPREDVAGWCQRLWVLLSQQREGPHHVCAGARVRSLMRDT